MQRGLELQEENADQEYKDLQKLQVRDHTRPPTGPFSVKVDLYVTPRGHGRPTVCCT